MFETNHTTEDPTVALSNEVAEFIPWRVVELRVLPGYQLYQRFADGIEGRVEMRELIFCDHAGVFESLRDPAVFAQVSIDPNFGSVQWANGIDIAPDASHDDIERVGVQVLR
jgi:hypothetical protein